MGIFYFWHTHSSTDARGLKKRTKLISLRRSCIHIFCCFDCAFTRGSNICQIYSFCRFLLFFIIWPARIMTILAILNHRIDLYFDMTKIILLNMNRHRQILNKNYISLTSVDSLGARIDCRMIGVPVTDGFVEFFIRAFASKVA